MEITILFIIYLNVLLFSVCLEGRAKKSSEKLKKHKTESLLSATEEFSLQYQNTLGVHMHA